MVKKRAKRKKDPQSAKERRRAKEQREALWVYVLIAIMVGLILYGLYIQVLHHS